jgi:hypothetical protein
MTTIESFKHGEHGGRVVSPSVKTQSPPPDLLAEVAADNLRADRQAMLQHAENPVVTFNREAAEMEGFNQYVEPYLESDWVERQTPEGQAPLYFTIKSFHWQIRNTVDGAASGHRHEYLLKVACMPWLPISGQTAAQRMASHEKRTGIFAVPQNLVNTPARESFPIAFFALSKFLKNHKPVSDFSIDPLLEISAPDVGHEDEERPIVPPPPTVADLIVGLTAALKANKPATA